MDPSGRAVSADLLGHGVGRLVQVVLVADEQEVRLAREQVDDVGQDRLAVHGYQRLGNSIARLAEPLSEPGHRYDDLHALTI